jgi:uncharacterized paraquat-inducible protein A
MNHVYHLCKNGRQQHGHREDCGKCNPKAAKPKPVKKNKLVKCPKCGKMAEKRALWGNKKDSFMYRMYAHTTEIHNGFPVITEHCMVKEVVEAQS